MPNDLRVRIEDRFRLWGRTVSARPLPVLLASLALALCCSAGLTRVWVDVTFESFLRQDDAVRLNYDAFRDQFGRDEKLIVAVTRDTKAAEGSAAGTVFDLAFLERLRALHEALETRVPYVDEVTSLVNARDTRGEGDSLLVGEFLDPWPETPEDLERLRKRARDIPLFQNTVLSSDASITTLSLDVQLYSSVGMEQDDLAGFDETGESEKGLRPLLTGAESQELVTAFHQVVDEFQSPDFELQFGGSTVMLQDIAAAMSRDMPRFVGLAILSIAVLLFVLFRRAVAVVIPLIVVVLSVTSTIGLMGWAAVPLHVPTQILPSFLLAVGVGDAVHLLSIFFQALRRGSSREDALAHALGHSGLALVLTSLTTAAGLASFASSGIAPIGAIGIFAPIGVTIALALSLTLLPALLSLVPASFLEAQTSPASRSSASSIAPLSDTSSDRSSDEIPQASTDRIDRFLEASGRFAIRHARWVLLAAIGFALIAIAGASRLTLSHDPLSWLGDEVEVARGMRFIDQALGGSMSFEVLVATDDVGGVRQPELLRRLAALGESLETDPRDGFVAGQTISLADVVMETHRALNEDREEAYIIPDDPQLVSQELLLFENSGSDELEEVVDTEFRWTRLSARMPWHDAVHYSAFFDIADADVQDRLGSVARVSTTGILVLLSRAMRAVVSSMAMSYLIALGVITPMLMLLLGSVRIGALAMIPNIMPILLTLGLMGIVGLPLDAFSLLIGGIALGLAVDDTIHFMHNYRRYRSQGQDLETAVSNTLRSAGRAMLITTVVLTTGFAGFMLSSMNNLSSLGILVSFAISVAFIGDILLAPALLAVLEPKTASPSAPVEASPKA